MSSPAEDPNVSSSSSCSSGPARSLPSRWYSRSKAVSVYFSTDTITWTGDPGDWQARLKDDAAAINTMLTNLVIAGLRAERDQERGRGRHDAPVHSQDQDRDQDQEYSELDTMSAPDAGRYKGRRRPPITTANTTFTPLPHVHITNTNLPTTAITSTRTRTQETGRDTRQGPASVLCHLPPHMTIDNLREDLLKLHQDLKSTVVLFGEMSALDVGSLRYQSKRLNWQNESHREKLVDAYVNEESILDEIERLQNRVAEARARMVTATTTTTTTTTTDTETTVSVAAATAVTERALWSSADCAQVDEGLQAGIEHLQAEGNEGMTEVEFRELREDLASLQRVSVAQAILEDARIYHRDYPSLVNDGHDRASLISWAESVEPDPEDTRGMFERGFDIESSPDMSRADLANKGKSTISMSAKEQLSLSLSELDLELKGGGEWQLDTEGVVGSSFEGGAGAEGDGMGESVHLTLRELSPERKRKQGR